MKTWLALPQWELDLGLDLYWREVDSFAGAGRDHWLSLVLGQVGPARVHGLQLGFEASLVWGEQALA